MTPVPTPPFLTPRRWLPVVAVTVGLFAVSFGLCVLRGALESDFASHPDEPAHVVTGLMVRDWIAQREPLHPLRYAQEYYRHYPKVALGQWPPVFYALQAAWTLPFGVSHASLLALMSAFTALTGGLLFASLRDELGAGAALVATALFGLAPLVQDYGSKVMTELPLALFCLAAALAFGRFIESGGATRHAMRFGAWSTVAIMTKGNALCLALVPPLALALSGRWRLLARPALWVAAAGIALVCAPWFWFALPISSSTWAGGSSPSLAYTQRAFASYGAALARLDGGVAFVLAALGLGIVALGRVERRGLWSALAALVVAVVLFHVVLPSSISDRHMLLAAPAWAALAVLGGRRVGFHAMGTRGRTLAPALLLVTFALERFHVPRKAVHGYGEAARGLLAHPRLDESTFLIASDSIGEGGFVSAMALAEPRPGHVVLRGSKVLAKDDWLGIEYDPYYRTTAELDRFLRDVPVGVVVLDESIEPRRWKTHHRLLENLLEKSPRWLLLGRFDVVRDGARYPRALGLWVQKQHQRLPRNAVDFSRVLGRNVPGVLDQE